MSGNRLEQDHLLFPDILWSRPQNIHKRQAGKILIVAGSRTMAGAALLTTEAAFRTGIGLAVLAYPESLRASIQHLLPEMMSLPLPETPAGSMSRAAVPLIQKATEDTDLVAIGPGLSRNPETQGMVRELIPAIAKPMVVDADGLNAVSEGDPAQILSGRSYPTVVTPHTGEMSRLIGKSTQDIEEHRDDIARDTARDWKCIVVLKGPRTLIAAPDGRVVRNHSGNRALATAGTGDVLTGIIATLVAQHPERAWEATATAVYLHGRAGERAGEKLGTRSVMASDVIAALPEVLKDEEAEAEKGERKEGAERGAEKS